MGGAYIPDSEDVCDAFCRKVLSTKEFLLGVCEADARGGYVKFHEVSGGGGGGGELWYCQLLNDLLHHFQPVLPGNHLVAAVLDDKSLTFFIVHLFLYLSQTAKATKQGTGGALYSCSVR